MKTKLYNTKKMIIRCLSIIACIVAFSTVQSNAQMQCNAGFYFTTVGGTFVVQFQDTSYTTSGQIVSYSWNFGDGTFSTQVSPTHTYNSIGTFLVCHKITASNGCTDSTCMTITIGSGCNLTAVVDTIGNGNTLTITPTGGTAPYSYLWSTGASTSTIQVNPLGVFCATVTDANGCTATDCYTFSSGGSCVALFSYNANGNTIQFANISTGTYSYLEWNFGDGTTASAQNPVHQFINGTYNVCLSLYDANGNVCDQYCIVITVNGGGSNTDTICGNIFWDNNGNGLMDAGENGIQQAAVFIYGNGLSFTAVSDLNGHYYALVSPGTYSIYYCTQFTGAVFTVPLTDTAGCGLYVVTLTAGQNLCGFNFGLQNTAVTIGGTVFNDANNNGTFDSGENGIPYQSIQIGNFNAYADANGNYSLNVPANTYNLIYSPSGAYAGYALTTPGTISVAATVVGNSYNGNNFGIYITPGSVNLSINIIPHTTVTPGFAAWYDLQVCNIGAMPTEGNVTMHYDAGLTFNYSSPAQSSINTTTRDITWSLPIIAPGDCQYIWVDFDALTSLGINDPTVELAMVTPTSGTDVDMSNNVDTVHQIVTSSWDPNNKLSIRTNTTNATQQIVSSQNSDQWITYTINFQNTGNASAVNIVLLDDLSADLDATSFEMTGSSHNCILTRNGSSLNFKFSGIMLPASVVNEPASHGFVSFRIKALNGLAAGHVISDNAAIYFDFNAPVITNFADVTMINSLGINTVEGNNFSFSVFPNPANNFANISYVLKGDATVNISIYDLAGKNVKSFGATKQLVGKHIVQWDAASLDNGMYLLKMEVDGKADFRKINVLK